MSGSQNGLKFHFTMFSNACSCQFEPPTYKLLQIFDVFFVTQKAKGSAEARKRTSEALKAFFSDPENRRKRSSAMKGKLLY